MNRIILFFACTVILFPRFSHAQEFRREASISAVEKEQYYKILLNPQVSSQLRSDYGDLRIYDQKGKEIPYLIQRSSVVVTENKFNKYKIQDYKKKKGGSELIIRNPEKSKIDNINVRIRNADVSKNMRLSGSDDNKSWYIIRQNYFFTPPYSEGKSSESEFMIDFPLSDYEYYKIDIDDSLSNPLNVLAAGYYQQQMEHESYIDLPSPKIVQRDSAKQQKSYLDISFDKPYYMNKILFVADSKNDYYRNADIFYKVPGSKVFSFFNTKTLSSRTENSLEADKLFAKDFQLVIYNEDDAPLKISGMKASEKKSYIIANLTAGEIYTIKFSSPSLLVPNYDLRHFQDKIPAVLPELAAGEVKDIEAKKEKVAENLPFFRSTWFVWGAIILVVLLLGFMSVKMVR
ncbi:MAG TPA: hypothetical protein VNW99_10605, partial [Cytophagaceae bacterium]|nr:hypothetical protein [Cytophagaceae bacterium]